MAQCHTSPQVQGCSLHRCLMFNSKVIFSITTQCRQNSKTNGCKNKCVCFLHDFQGHPGVMGPEGMPGIAGYTVSYSCLCYNNTLLFISLSLCLLRSQSQISISLTDSLTCTHSYTQTRSTITLKCFLRVCVSLQSLITTQVCNKGVLSPVLLW